MPMTAQQAEITTERVSMVWPADLKAEVRQLVGSRGLTDFTLDAVRDKLGRLERGEPEPVEAGEADEPVADRVAPDARRPRAAEPNETLDPAAVAKLPLSERMRYARTLIDKREGNDTTDDVGARRLCSQCKDELVNGECWTCLPG
jgi:anaerobic glycerol-3-phosphate dehydrogenase